MSLTSSASRPFRPPRNLTGEVIDHLTDEIVAGNLAPLTRLPTEHELMQSLGVSRTVVREAIAALRAEGLVETRQGAGAFVAADPRRRPFRIDPDGLQSIEQVLNVMELRLAVEVEAAGLAAQNRTKESLAAIHRADRAFADAIASGDEAIDQDFEFHAAIGEATGNPYFPSFLKFLGRLIIPRRSVHIGEGVSGAGRALYMERVRDEHVEIVKALEAQDLAGARRAMRTHLKRGRERYRRAAAGAQSASTPPVAAAAPRRPPGGGRRPR